MSNLPGNQFAEDHDEMYHNIGQTVVSEEGQTDATLIWSAIENHATATLALAHEQRTATLALIAASTAPDGTYALDPELVHAAQSKLAERLGLGDTK